MNRLAMEIWVCQANIERFHSMHQEAHEPGRQHLLAGLLAQEEQKLEDLIQVQDYRGRLLQMTPGHPVRAVIETLLDDSMVILEAAAGVIHLVDPVTGDLRMIASRGFLKPLLATVQSDDNSTCSRAMLSGTRILVEDVAQAAATDRRTMGELGFVAVQSAPLRRKAHVIGTLSTHWRSATRPPPDQQNRLDMRIGQALADLAPP